jgi:hypothetical protein
MKKSDQGKCCTRNLERTNVRKKQSGATEMQQWHKETRRKTADTTKEGEVNRQLHHRAKQETGATSRKQGDII